MGKRSSFKRRAQDFYETPPGYIPPVPAGSRFCEPCCGDGALVESLCYAGLRCVMAYDISPGIWSFGQADALGTSALNGADYIITNPPWTRAILHPMIEHFRKLRPTWLLFDADWMHTKQATPLLPYCHQIVSVGRVSWMQNGTSGKENSAWYRFEREPGQAVFNGRAA